MDRCSDCASPILIDAPVPADSADAAHVAARAAPDSGKVLVDRDELEFIRDNIGDAADPYVREQIAAIVAAVLGEPNG
jgi:hypothetical protein